MRKGLSPRDRGERLDARPRLGDVEGVVMQLRVAIVTAEKPMVVRVAQAHQLPARGRRKDDVSPPAGARPMGFARVFSLCSVFRIALMLKGEC